MSCSTPSDPDSDAGGDPDPGARTYRMGFSHVPPRPTLEAVLATIGRWQPRGDAAVVHVTPPWKSLLADTGASLLIRREHLPLVEWYRSHGMAVVVMIDATDGLDRRRESPELAAAGRSIGEPAIRAIYRDFAVAVDTILRPDYLGVAMETNLVRLIAPPAVYEGARAAATSAAAALRARGTAAKLFVSVQVEVAWGRMPPTGAFAGIAQDRADFPFIDALGLSSYPNLGGVARPDDLPPDYYRALVPDGALPMMVLEGGWSSSSGAAASSPEMQAGYIRRQMELADRASLIGVFQITFTDLDVASLGPLGPQLAPFASLGLVRTDLGAKPALAEWDRAFARPLRGAGLQLRR